MDVSFILITLLLGAVATWLAGDKWASKTALFFSTAAFAVTAYVIYLFTQGDVVSMHFLWIKKPLVIFAL